MPVIMYRDALRQASDEALTNQGNEFSSLGVDHLLHDLLQSGRLMPILDSKLNENSETMFKPFIGSFLWADRMLVITKSRLERKNYAPP